MVMLVEVVMKAIVVIEIVLNKELDKEVVDEFDISSLYFSKAKNFNSLLLAPSGALVVIMG